MGRMKSSKWFKENGGKKLIVSGISQKGQYKLYCQFIEKHCGKPQPKDSENGN